MLEALISPEKIQLQISRWKQIRSSNENSWEDGFSININGLIKSEADITIALTDQKLDGTEFSMTFRCKSSTELTRPDGAYVVGNLNYWLPGSSDSWANSRKAGSVLGYGRLDRDTMEEFLGALVSRSDLKLRVGLGMKATSVPTKDFLTFIENDSRTTYRWHEKAVAINEIEIVIGPFDTPQCR